MIMFRQKLTNLCDFENFCIEKILLFSPSVFYFSRVSKPV
eukprot:UN28117